MFICWVLLPKLVPLYLFSGQKLKPKSRQKESKSRKSKLKVSNTKLQGDRVILTGNVEAQGEGEVQAEEGQLEEGLAEEGQVEEGEAKGDQAEEEVHEEAASS